jgi:hypothetical protein
MAEKYGFYTSELTITPFLSLSEIQLDCQQELIPGVFRRAGRSYYIIPHYAVEPYFKSKGIPEQIIKEKLIKLKIYSEEDRENLRTEILSRKLKSGAQLDLLSLISS